MLYEARSVLYSHRLLGEREKGPETWTLGDGCIVPVASSVMSFSASSPAYMNQSISSFLFPRLVSFLVWWPTGIHVGLAAGSIE